MAGVCLSVHLLMSSYFRYGPKELSRKENAAEEVKGLIMCIYYDHFGAGLPWLIGLLVFFCFILNILIDFLFLFLNLIVTNIEMQHKCSSDCIVYIFWLVLDRPCASC